MVFIFIENESINFYNIYICWTKNRLIGLVMKTFEKVFLAAFAFYSLVFIQCAIR